MVKRGTRGLLVGMLFALVPPIVGHNTADQKPRIRVFIPWRPYLVSVDIWLYTADDSLFVPYCGEDESGRRDLCGLAAHLEKMTPQGWRRAELRNGTLTGKDPHMAPGDVIPPGSKGSFTFIFSTDAFGIPPGTHLRVVVDSWPDEKSMRAHAPPIKVTSPEFVCPP